jgi:cob(I)alamin adenosyltransferase
MITTKNGDRGETTVFGGKKRLKYDPQIEALGQIDELFSLLGLIRSYLKNNQEKKLFLKIQKNLYLINSILAGQKDKEKAIIKTLNNDIGQIERINNHLSSKLTPLNKFILPGDEKINGWLHFLRAVCRRVERRVVFYLFKEKLEKKYKIIIQYLNRLSDLFFLLSRSYQKKEIILG